MLLLAAAAACMPAHDEALNDLSLIPPVSVTMQPRILADVAAELVAEADVLVLPPAGAELVLLPHAAMTSVADTASAAVAHALCFTLTSTGPAHRSAWPRIRPGLTRRLCLVVSAGKGTRGYLACSLPNRNPIMIVFLACRTDTRGLLLGFCAFLQGTLAYRLSAAWLAVPSDAGALPLGAGTPGKSRMTVSPPPGVSVSRAVPPFEVTRRCTMARPSPVPFGFEVVNRRKARSRSSALMPGPSSATVTCAPAVVTAAVTVMWPPALSASSALAIRLSRTCSR